MCIRDRVIDAWYDSGSMPFAQYHYPFENKELFEKNYPADFIAEGIDQTRGWFYSLHAIGTFLFKDKAFRNLIVNDLILDKEGRKMSKHLGNVVDPFNVMDNYGADILRWYLIVSSPPWRPKMFNEDDLVEVRNKFFDTLINTYRFFVLYCHIQNLKPETLRNIDPSQPKSTEIDRWIISAYNSVLKKYTSMMDNYDITRAARILSDFLVDDLSNWYVRRNRRRFRSPSDESDKMSAYSTLYEVLTGVLRLVSPFSPFITEYLYRELTGEESVHLSYIGSHNENLIDEELEDSMRTAQTIVSLVRAMRVRNGLKIKQPLRKLLVSVLSDKERNAVIKMKDVILEEVNIKELEIADVKSSVIKKKAKLNFKTAGPRFGRDVKKVQTLVSGLTEEEISSLVRNGEIEKDGFNISAENVTVLTEDIPGWVIESDSDITAAIDIELDQELISDGIAREFVSKVQAIRKELNMDVNEKITIICSPDEEIMEVLKSREEYIAGETMASEIIYSPKDNLNGFEEINLNGRLVKISVRKLNK
ncbi:MAG: class I tRNA ligase family protein, partial [Ignavibacteria bacterium]|nr:class I tRNA ligase family protein [Ignavibacteria bacterium]